VRCVEHKHSRTRRSILRLTDHQIAVVDIERHIGDYFVFDVDGALAACVALHPYPEEAKGEMACVCVAPKFENQGIGMRLMGFLEEHARGAGVKELFCLSTQAINFFLQKGGYRLATPDDLPAARRQRYEVSGRRSKVLLQRLG
jgi:amino-acid N-acetyltransferase